jgi:hypothetical protein
MMLGGLDDKGLVQGTFFDGEERRKQSWVLTYRRLVSWP